MTARQARVESARLVLAEARGRIEAQDTEGKKSYEVFKVVTQTDEAIFDIRRWLKYFKKILINYSNMDFVARGDDAQTKLHLTSSLNVGG